MLPKTGRNLHQDKDELAFAAIMAEALTEGLGSTHQAVKIAMRWTGASERSVKHWLAGTHAPRAIHLLGLIRHSDEVLRRLLIASGRRDALIALEVSALRGRLIETLAFLDKLFPDAVSTADGASWPRGAGP